MLGRSKKLPYWTLFRFFFRYFVYPTTHTSECQADSCATAVRADKSLRSRSRSELAVAFSTCPTEALVCRYVRFQPFAI